MEDINTKRTALANNFAAAGAALLDFTRTACAIAAIPDTEPEQYVAAGTPEHIAALLPATIDPQRRQRHGDRPTEPLSFEDDAPAAPAVTVSPAPRVDELTTEQIDQAWNSMPGGAAGWLKQFGYQQFAREIQGLVMARALAVASGAARPTDDELWDATIRDRDTYHDWADKLAEAISKHFDAYIGEHSNTNLPWAEALEAIEGAHIARRAQPTDRDAALESAVGELVRCERFNEWSGEGGGVYAREDGEYIKLEDAEAAIRALKGKSGEGAADGK